MNDFQPYTPQLGIVGSSYQLQMGKVNNFWTVRLVKGRDVLASKIFKDVPHPEEIPLGNQITGWILSVLAIPNLNTYQIQKTVSFIRQKAIQTQEDQKNIRKSAGKSESTEKVLEKVPENAQIKRPQAKGWIKEDQTAGEIISDEIAELSPGLVQQNVELTGQHQEAIAHIRSKKLPKIPVGEGFTPQPFMYRARDAKSAKISEFKLDINGKKIISEVEMLKRQLQNLEKRVSKLEFENAELRSKLV